VEYRVEELAAAADLSVDTIRYYQKLNLLASPVKRGRIGVYSSHHRRRLDEIRRLSDEGFTLTQIGRLLDTSSDRILEALRGDGAVEVVGRAELAELTGLDPSLLAIAVDTGLVRAHPGTDDSYGQDTADMLRAAAVILESGLPLDELTAIAVEHAAHVENIVDRAIDLFGRLAPQDGAEENDGSALISRLVPAVSDLVAQHFRQTLVSRATQRVAEHDVVEVAQ